MKTQCRSLSGLHYTLCLDAQFHDVCTSVSVSYAESNIPVSDIKPPASTRSHRFNWGLCNVRRQCGTFISHFRYHGNLRSAIRFSCIVYMAINMIGGNGTGNIITPYLTIVRQRQTILRISQISISLQSFDGEFIIRIINIQDS